MKVADLQKLLRAADPAAVLVSPRILERVIREACDLPTLYWNIPHPKSYVVDRQTLFRHAEQADLEIDPSQLLPSTVILLARPAAEELSGPERQVLLLKYWRALFHCEIDFALGPYRPGGPLSPEALRERIEQIGRTEFEEIRVVLEQDRNLAPNADDRTTYVEFAAVFLELTYFASNLLPNVFPGIRDYKRVEQLLGRDVDAPALFARTRLQGAPDPELRRDTRSDESDEAYWGLVRAAQRGALNGNLVRAAILRTRAARIAPAAQTGPTRLQAQQDVQALTGRLKEALELTPTEAEEWSSYLTLLLDKADQGSHPIEARLLFDLQEVCIDAEREVHTLDVVEWLVSGFRRPIKRPLPSQRMVRITKHLRNAVSRLGGVRLSDSDRAHLHRLLQTALRASEEGMRTKFGPVLIQAMQDVGLQPRNALERVAFEKIVAELLDRIINYGFLTFSDLRDAISRNQLKFPDLTGPEDFLRGDPLVLLDRRLAALLDGVYRPSEFYVRWLERFTSLKFGTALGRFVTRFVTLPFGGALLLLYVLGALVKLFVAPERYPLLESFVLLLQGPLYHPEGAPPTEAPDVVEAYLGPRWAWHYVLVFGVGIFLLALLHSRAFRQRCKAGALAVFRGLRTVFFDWPRRAMPVGWVKHFVTSGAFQLVYWYLVKPAFVVSILVLLRPDPFASFPVLVLSFGVALLVINLRVSRAASEAVSDGLSRFQVLLRAGLLQNLVHAIIQVFKFVLDMLEYLLFTVDEWLRFRGGDSRTSLVVRTILSVLWFPISYVGRFYMVVLIEPGINPLKFPISSIAAKIVYPYTYSNVALQEQLAEPLAPLMGAYLAKAFILFGVFFWLPDVFGFLVWEMKENWSLYRSNRGKALAPVMVGAHGETVRGLLQPGFHSGTIPRLYAKLREAERHAYKTRNWHPARYYREQLEEVARAMTVFVTRELIALVGQSRSWQGQAIEVGQVHLTINRIRFTLRHSAYPASEVEVELQLRDGWLVAGLDDLGWLCRLTADQLRAFTAALAALYKLAGIDLVQEQVRANLPPSVTSFEIDARGLVLYPAEGPPLALSPWDRPRARADEERAASLPGLAIERLVFARTPLSWEQLAESWGKDEAGQGHPALPCIGVELVGVVGPPAPPCGDHQPAAPPREHVLPAPAAERPVNGTNQADVEKEQASP